MCLFCFLEKIKPFLFSLFGLIKCNILTNKKIKAKKKTNDSAFSKYEEMPLLYIHSNTTNCWDANFLQGNVISIEYSAIIACRRPLHLSNSYVSQVINTVPGEFLCLPTVGGLDFNTTFFKDSNAQVI